MMTAKLASFPSIEISLVTELTSSSDFGDGYRFLTNLPADLDDLVNTREIVVTRITRTTGVTRNFMQDRPVCDLDTFASTKASADLAARKIEAALYNLRGKQLQIGVVQGVMPVVGPRWLPDPAPQFYRYNQSHELRFHGGGVMV